MKLVNFVKIVLNEFQTKIMLRHSRKYFLELGEHSKVQQTSRISSEFQTCEPSEGTRNCLRVGRGARTGHLPSRNLPESENEENGKQENLKNQPQRISV